MRTRLFRKRQLWVPTWQAWVLFLAAGGLIGMWLFASAYGFLAVTERKEDTRTMVVESWTADENMEAVARALLDPESQYETVWLTGPQFDKGYYISEEYKTFSELNAATLEALGVPAEKIRVVPASKSQRHRTFTAAVKAKEAFEDLDEFPDSFDLFTADVHARRSRLVYQRVFDSHAEVGVVALPPIYYDADEWYRYSAGVKAVVFESIAYAYELIGRSGR